MKKTGRAWTLLAMVTLACAPLPATGCGGSPDDEDLEPEPIDEKPAWSSVPEPSTVPAAAAEPRPSAPAATVSAAATVPGGPTVSAAADFDLPAAVSLVEKGSVKTGEELERAVNDAKINHVDVDADGTYDPIQVIELRAGDRRTLALRAIPSTKRTSPPDEVAVPVATIEFAPARELVTVTARWAVPDLVAAPIVYTVPVAWAGPVLEVPAVSFLHWLYVVERPIFVGVWFLDPHPVHVKLHGKGKHKKVKIKHKHGKGKGGVWVKIH